jgi:hypothetical protein
VVFCRFNLQTPPMSEVTHILSAIEHGDRHAAEQLLPLVYGELRRLAAAKRAQERPRQTVQATARVHELYVFLVDLGGRHGIRGGVPVLPEALRRDA